ncbi:hypothetical protein BDFB_000184 [Asbolus verrucosus]|uniref:Uncharacterized protein n=1 Tax=Asbolus verrucosus TaxID=1661398 RepID=A0A482W1J1_ASBVE|nr:hypothetical protein BDFB_000184 [Asbolus verrucosus]
MSKPGRRRRCAVRLDRQSCDALSSSSPPAPVLVEHLNRWIRYGVVYKCVRELVGRSEPRPKHNKYLLNN